MCSSSIEAFAWTSGPLSRARPCCLCDRVPALNEPHDWLRLTRSDGLDKMICTGCCTKIAGAHLFLELSEDSSGHSQPPSLHSSP